MGWWIGWILNGLFGILLDRAEDPLTRESTALSRCPGCGHEQRIVPTGDARQDVRCRKCKLQYEWLDPLQNQRPLIPPVRAGSACGDVGPACEEAPGDGWPAIEPADDERNPYRRP